MVIQPALLSAVAFFAGARPGVRALDIACGTGVTFDYLLAQGVESLTAIDISDEMARIAQGKYAHDPRVTVLAGDFLQLEAPPFDCALLYNAYPHFLDKPALPAQETTRIAAFSTLPAQTAKNQILLVFEHIVNSPKAYAWEIFLC